MDYRDEAAIEDLVEAIHFGNRDRANEALDRYADTRFGVRNRIEITRARLNARASGKLPDVAA